MAIKQMELLDAKEMDPQETEKRRQHELVFRISFVAHLTPHRNKGSLKIRHTMIRECQYSMKIKTMWAVTLNGLKDMRDLTDGQRKTGLATFR